MPILLPEYCVVNEQRMVNVRNLIPSFLLALHIVYNAPLIRPEISESFTEYVLEIYFPLQNNFKI